MTDPRAVPTTVDDSARVLVVVFRVGGERYAMAASEVLRVIEPEGIGWLPRLPGAVLGITHHRGRLVTVLDLLVTLTGEGRRAPKVPPQVIVMETGHASVGIAADGIDEIVRVDVSGGQSGPLPGLSVVHHRGRPLALIQAPLLRRRIRELLADPRAA